MNKFSITSNVKSVNTVPFSAGITKQEFPVGVFLKSVSVESKGKEGQEADALVFHFVSDLNPAKTAKESTHIEFQIEETDAKFAEKLTAMQSRIKHIYEAFHPFPTEGINVEGENPTTLDLLKAVAAAFNANIGTPEEPKTIFTKQPVHLKLIYDKNDYLKFPYSPNFIEKASNKVSILSINPKYDKLVQKAANSTASASNLPPDPFGEYPPF